MCLNNLAFQIELRPFTQDDVKTESLLTRAIPSPANAQAKPDDHQHGQTGESAPAKRGRTCQGRLRNRCGC
jgi:hypothetical protein